MPGWTWEYVEATVTAARLDAIVAPLKPPDEVNRITIEQLRAQFPNGMRAGD